MTFQKIDKAKKKRQRRMKSGQIQKSSHKEMNHNQIENANIDFNIDP